MIISAVRRQTPLDSISSAHPPQLSPKPLVNDIIPPLVGLLSSPKLASSYHLGVGDDGP